MRPLPLAAAGLAAALSLPACEIDATDCIRTTMTARSATKLDLGVLSHSAVIQARLTTKSGALPAHRLTFEVLDDGASVYTADATTGKDGTARVDLKRVDPDALVAVARGDAFQASFRGDGQYCGSADRAGFHAVRG